MLFKKILLLLTSIFIFLFLTEIGASLIRPKPTFPHISRLTKKALRQKKADEVNKTPLYVPSEILGWQFQPNVEFVLKDCLHCEHNVVKTNSLGLYDDEPTSKPKVFIVGDSYIEGIAVPKNKHFTTLLEKSFSGVEFWNMGVSGYGSAQNLLLIRTCMQIAKPKHVIFAVYFGNDFTDNKFSTNISMLGIPGYRREWVPYIENKEIVYGKDFMKWTWLLDRHIYHYLATRAEKLGALDKGVKAAMDVIEIISGELRFQNVNFSVLLIPDDGRIQSREVVRDYEVLTNFCIERDIDFISLLEPFRLTKKRTMGYDKSDGSIIDLHWNSNTHRLVADFIGSHLAKRGLIPFGGEKVSVVR